MSFTKQVFYNTIFFCMLYDFVAYFSFALELELLLLLLFYCFVWVYSEEDREDKDESVSYIFDSRKYW